jgi:hypothetical protein
MIRAVDVFDTAYVPSRAGRPSRGQEQFSDSDEERGQWTRMLRDAQEEEAEEDEDVPSELEREEDEAQDMFPGMVDMLWPVVSSEDLDSAQRGTESEGELGDTTFVPVYEDVVAPLNDASSSRSAAGGWTGSGSATPRARPIAPSEVPTPRPRPHSAFSQAFARIDDDSSASRSTAVPPRHTKPDASLGAGATLDPLISLDVPLNDLSKSRVSDPSSRTSKIRLRPRTPRPSRLPAIDSSDVVSGEVLEDQADGQPLSLDLLAGGAQLGPQDLSMDLGDSRRAPRKTLTQLLASSQSNSAASSRSKTMVIAVSNTRPPPNSASLGGSASPLHSAPPSPVPTASDPTMRLNRERGEEDELPLSRAWRRPFYDTPRRTTRDSLASLTDNEPMIDLDIHEAAHLELELPVEGKCSTFSANVRRTARTLDAVVASRLDASAALGIAPNFFAIPKPPRAPSYASERCPCPTCATPRHRLAGRVEGVGGAAPDGGGGSGIGNVSDFCHC